MSNKKIVTDKLKEFSLNLNKIEGYEEYEIKLVKKPKPKKSSEPVKDEAYWQALFYGEMQKVLKKKNDEDFEEYFGKDEKETGNEYD